MPEGRDARPVALGLGEGATVVFEGRRHSAAELTARIRAHARDVLADVHPGERVALWLLGGVDHLTLLLACLEVGAVPMPIQDGSKGPEVRDVLSHARPALLVVGPAGADRLGAVAGTGVRRVHRIDADAPPVAPERAREASSGREPDAPALVLHTSGTKGRAKAVVLSRASVEEVVRDRISRAGLGPTSVLLTASCLSQSVGLYQSLAATAAGATLVLLPSYEVEGMVSALLAHRPTHLLMAVEAFDTLLHDPRVTAEALGTLSFACAGADRVTARVQDRFHALTGRSLAVSYGLTESSWALFNPGDRFDKRLSLGQPGPGVQVRIASEDGGEASVGDVGEIQVRSPRTMRGYLGDEGSTREAFVDGWLATGDLGRRDGDGWFWFAGRKKNLVVLSSGDNVSPVEVENAILRHPSVSHCAVAGVATPGGAEVPWAFVVRKDGSLSREDLDRFLRERLSDFKVPRRIEFVARLPVGPTGKVAAPSAGPVP